MLPKLLASICNHQTWLRDTLPRGHPLLVSELFTVHDSLLLGALPHVHEMTRPMGECTGLPLSLQTHLLLRQHLHPLPAPQQPLPAPVYLGDAAVSNRGDLTMRALRPLPKNYHLTKLSIVALWRAWWCDTLYIVCPESRHKFPTIELNMKTYQNLVKKFEPLKKLFLTRLTCHEFTTLPFFDSTHLS